MSTTVSNSIESGNDTAPGGWQKITDLPEFVKFRYKTSPYRVIVHKSDTGHWEARFVSVYGTDSYCIRGNCGGSALGRLQALGAAESFMSENPWGCPPPSEYAEEKN